METRLLHNGFDTFLAIRRLRKMEWCLVKSTNVDFNRPLNPRICTILIPFADFKQNRTEKNAEINKQKE